MDQPGESTASYTSVMSPVWPLVGREGEQAALRAALTEMGTGAGGMYLIAGDAGAGKTALIESVLSSSAAQVLLLGMDGAEPDLQNVILEISVDSPDGEAAVAELARVWQERCPIYLALQKPTDVAVRFQAA